MLLFVANMALFVPNVHAQVPDRAVGGTLPIRVLGDRILLRAALQTETWHKETHIILDFSRPTGIELHREALRSLSWGKGEQTLKIVADGFRVDASRDGVIQSQDSALTDITARYDNELEQIDVAATVGWPVLKDWALRINLAEETVTFTEADRATADQARSWATTVVEGVRIFDDRVLVPVNHDDGKPAWMEFDTSGYHTFIDKPMTEARGKPYGKVDDVFFGNDRQQKLSGVVALFPKGFAVERQARYDAEFAVEQQAREQIDVQRQAAREQGREPSADLVIPPRLIAKPIVEFDGDVLLRSGIGLLSAYDLEINPVAGYFAFTKLVDSNYSDGDEAFYEAATKETVAALRAYLKTHTEDRNVEEGVSRAFALGIDQGVRIPALTELIDIGLKATQDRRRFAYVFEFLQPLFADYENREGRTDLIVALGEKAMQHISYAQDPKVRQHVQLMLGDRYLAKGDAHTAWKYLLAAGFNGDPQLDGIVRHELGRAYEALGRDRRAYSSYKRSLSKFVGLPSEMRESARQALERLRPKLDANDPLLQEEIGS